MTQYPADTRSGEQAEQPNAKAFELGSLGSGDRLKKALDAKGRKPNR